MYYKAYYQNIRIFSNWTSRLSVELKHAFSTGTSNKDKILNEEELVAYPKPIEIVRKKKTHSSSLNVS